MASNVSEMSESNLKKLKNAYRHPFEYISPLLYRKNTARTEPGNKSLLASDLFCANEEDFNRLFKSQNSFSELSFSELIPGTPSPSVAPRQ